MIENRQPLSCESRASERRTAKQMCGICGAFGLTGALDPQIKEAVPRMTRTLQHRGPDGENFFDDERVGLGHRRLSIIDIAGGTQPMTNEDGSIWTVFNGEIYNHKALRAKLASRGHEFRTHCDTEVIVHAYEEYGTACASHLEGMFAFAIYDQKKKAVYLARDRLGKKPLFYTVLRDTLHFASEMKALSASPAWSGEWNPDAFEEYFALGYIMAPATAYRQVFKLEPGSYLMAHRGELTLGRYWDIDDFDTDDRGQAAILDDLASLLGDAVGCRLESEVPLGAFLSGGIDSGLVVSYMSELGETSPTTCSVGFTDSAHNELEAARNTANMYRTSHHSHVLETDLSEAVEEIAAAFDEPFADSSAIPSFFLCQIARQHVTVCLSGDGGDETFGGYDFRYTPHALESRVRRYLPGRPARNMLRWLGNNWPQSSRMPRWLRLSTYLRNLGVDAATAYYFDLCFLKPHDVETLLGITGRTDPRESSVFSAVTEPYSRCPSDSPLQKAQYADLKIYLPNDVLVKVDRMSMLHSLEIRSPLLDHRLAELAFRVPTRTKLPRLAPKHLLRELATDRLPKENLHLPKHGFTAPVGGWFRGFLGDRFEDEILTSKSILSGIVDLSCARLWLREHRQGQKDRSYPLWALWSFEAWARRQGPNAS